MEYQLYETPEFLDGNWSMEYPGVPCEVCGMEDLPVFLLSENGVLEQCKWCMELYFLTLHLELAKRESRVSSDLSMMQFLTAFLTLLASCFLILSVLSTNQNYSGVALLIGGLASGIYVCSFEEEKK